MRFIAIRSYDNYIPAHIMMGRLSNENINCHLQNEHTASLGLFLMFPGDGIKLMVPESQLERAMELIFKFEKEANENEINPVDPGFPEKS